MLGGSSCRGEDSQEERVFPGVWGVDSYFKPGGQERLQREAHISKKALERAGRVIFGV